MASSPIEPTRALPLRWGLYADRYVLGLVLIVSGGLVLQASNTWTLPLILLGTLSHAVGWSILPARGWRRFLAVVFSTPQICLLLTGPLSVWSLVVPYLCWMLVRRRPPLSYVTALLPLGNGIVLPFFFTEYSSMPWALGISMAVFVGSAWIARALARLPVSQSQPVVL